MNKVKKGVIIGATSGIGLEVARILLAEGWQLGLAGRRTSILESLQASAPQQIVTETIDVTQEGADQKLGQLIDKLDGMDLFLLSSGIGYQNSQLDSSVEMKTVQTNVDGFVRLTTAAFHFFKEQGNGHLAVISSIAGTKGLGIAPAYSASKRFQNCYLDALEQLAVMSRINISFTDIRPGFVQTALLNDNKHYPLLMEPSNVARHIVKALKKKKRVAIIDWRYRILVACWQVIPRCIWKRMPVKNK